MSHDLCLAKQFTLMGRLSLAHKLIHPKSPNCSIKKSTLLYNITSMQLDCNTLRKKEMASTQADGQNSLLGFNLGNRRRPQRVDPDGMSVISNVSTKGPFAGRKKLSSEEYDLESLALSETNEAIKVPREFLIQCQGGEIVFVNGIQGSLVLQRSRYFRESLEESSKEGNGTIVNKPNWSTALARRMVEVLSTGSTWIPNDAAVFSELDTTCSNLGIDLRLASLINNHDTLTKSSTRLLFSLLDIEKYQFKLRATVKSSQWIQLLKSNILLMSRSRVLQAKLAKCKADLAKNAIPSHERLKRCDLLCADFCVYGDGNMQSLFTIMALLTPTMNTKQRRARALQREELKVILQIRTDALSPDLLTHIWRMTDSTFVVSSDADMKFLNSFQVPTSKLEKDAQSKTNQSKESASTASTRSTTTSHSPPASGVPTHISVHKASATTKKETDAAETSPNGEDHSSDSLSNTGVQCRTLTATSFLVLKQLMDYMNIDEPDLAACVVVQAPTPDTLGRLVNATRQTSNPRLDFDLEQNVFFACKTSKEAKVMLEYMADYSKTAVIQGDFQLFQQTR